MIDRKRTVFRHMLIATFLYFNTLKYYTSCIYWNIIYEIIKEHQSNLNVHFLLQGLMDYCVRILKKVPYVFCDYHGHSRRKNVFLYGCSSEESWLDDDRNKIEEPLDFLVSFTNLCSVWIQYYYHDNAVGFFKFKTTSYGNTVQLLHSTVTVSLLECYFI